MTLVTIVRKGSPTKYISTKIWKMKKRQLCEDLGERVPNGKRSKWSRKQHDVFQRQGIKVQWLEKSGHRRERKDMRPVKWQWEDHGRPCRTWHRVQIFFFLILTGSHCDFKWGSEMIWYILQKDHLDFCVVDICWGKNRQEDISVKWCYWNLRRNNEGLDQRNINKDSEKLHIWNIFGENSYRTYRRVENRIFEKRIMAIDLILSSLSLKKYFYVTNTEK